LRLELVDKKYEAALKIARQIQTQQPKSPLGFDREADIHMSQKRFSQALKAYELSLAKGSGTTGLIKLHRAFSMAGDAKTADQRLAGWIKQHPNDLAARTYAADFYMSTQRNREAIAQYEIISKSKPDNVTALNNLASLYQREKDSRALATAEKALKLAPDHPFVQDTLGWILVELGQIPRGLELLKKATGKAPESASVRYHYAVALARSGNKLAARKELEAAILSGKKFPEIDDAKIMLKNL
jgi:putative PEP-CTERM system TPR-repeat lipoprotein